MDHKDRLALSVPLGYLAEVDQLGQLDYPDHPERKYLQLLSVHPEPLVRTVGTVSMALQVPPDLRVGQVFPDLPDLPAEMVKMG